MNTSPLLSVHLRCDVALQWTRERLLLAGLDPVQTFDLNTARAGLHDCSCPHHGKNDCDCQMVVLLIYGKTESPTTLILHGNDGQTWLSLVSNSIRPSDESTRSMIERALQIDQPE